MAVRPGQLAWAEEQASGDRALKLNHTNMNKKKCNAQGNLFFNRHQNPGIKVISGTVVNLSSCYREAIAKLLPDYIF